MSDLCPICERRRGKRFCPGVGRSRWGGHGKSETICAPCCGAEREVSIDCPADCPYLIAAHRYEAQRPRVRRGGQEPAFPKIGVDQEFLEDHQALLVTLSWIVVRFAAEQPEVRDPEVLTALDALAQGYQTLESGLYYEQPPTGVAAQALYQALGAALKQFSDEQQQKSGTSLRSGDALRAVVFLRRLGQMESNGRPRARGFLEFLKRQLPAGAKGPEAPRLIIPGA